MLRTFAVPAALALVLLASGCGGDDKVGEGSNSITLATAFTPGGDIYSSGAKQEYALTFDGEEVTPTWDPATGYLTWAKLPEGDYELVAAQRPCIDNCDVNTGERRDECKETIDVSGDTEVTVTWEAGVPCQVKVGGLPEK